MTDLSKLEEIWGIYEMTKVVHCITFDGANFFCRPVSGVAYDGDTIVCATAANTKKVAQADSLGRAAFYFYDTEKHHYACLSGPAEISRDRKWKEKLWRDDWTKYFPGGIDDEDYVILKMKIENIDYVTEV